MKYQCQKVHTPYMEWREMGTLTQIFFQKMQEKIFGDAGICSFVYGMCISNNCLFLSKTILFVIRLRKLRYWQQISPWSECRLDPVDFPRSSLTSHSSVFLLAKASKQYFIVVAAVLVLSFFPPVIFMSFCFRMWLNHVEVSNDTYLCLSFTRLLNYLFRPNQCTRSSLESRLGQ